MISRNGGINLFFNNRKRKYYYKKYLEISKGYQSCQRVFVMIQISKQNIQDEAYSFNHDQLDKTHKQIAFPFSKNDISIFKWISRQV
ncbi:unnamed protein product [Paramecium pentaurelia]|uniref:Uncharacterized protein n=1 Tax=Paramecium pentaurelia TaxID=43138 RepID=A0A8S1SMS6_9CILI|nr:unnamed protein product [Paramecium pentaurelia]